MSDLEDLKTRLKIAKSKLQNKNLKKAEKKGVFLGNAFKLGTELVAAVVVAIVIVIEGVVVTVIVILYLKS